MLKSARVPLPHFPFSKMTGNAPSVVCVRKEEELSQYIRAQTSSPSQSTGATQLSPEVDNVRSNHNGAIHYRFSYFLILITIRSDNDSF
jgi:hypothetical protein